jgi:hypothetical protein
MILKNRNRELALLAGEKYFTGSPCNRGHEGKRYSSNSGCVDCCNELRRKRRQSSPDLKEKERIYKSEWRKARYNTDEMFATQEKIKRQVRRVFNKYLANKDAACKAKSSVNIVEICEHLLAAKPHDYESDKYDIDHVIPVSAWDLTDSFELFCCWHPRNLQWLNCYINRHGKNSRYKEEDKQRLMNELKLLFLA